MHRSHRSFCVAGLAGACLWVGFTPCASADLMYDYQATSVVAQQNPTAQDWNVLRPTSNVTVGAVDVGGTPAWSVNDNATASTDLRLYQIIPPAADALIARTTDGWVLETELLVVNTNDILDLSVIVSYEDGANNYTMRFGSDADGNPIVRLGSTVASAHTVAGGAGTFNTYSLRFDPIAQSADLFVNGLEVYSNYVGPVRGVAANIAWGSGDGASIGHGQFNRVSFTSPVPEPGSLALLALGGGLMALRTRRAEHREA